jgi:hypothetical protein
MPNQRLLKNGRGRNRSHSADNSVWKWLWTSLKTDYLMNELILNEYPIKYFRTKA